MLHLESVIQCYSVLVLLELFEQLPPKKKKSLVLPLTHLKNFKKILHCRLRVDDGRKLISNSFFPWSWPFFPSSSSSSSLLCPFYLWISKSTIIFRLDYILLKKSYSFCAQIGFRSLANALKAFKESPWKKTFTNPHFYKKRANPPCHFLPSLSYTWACESVSNY